MKLKPIVTAGLFGVLLALSGCDEDPSKTMDDAFNAIFDRDAVDVAEFTDTSYIIFYEEEDHNGSVLFCTEATGNLALWTVNLGDIMDLRAGTWSFDSSAVTLNLVDNAELNHNKEIETTSFVKGQYYDLIDLDGGPTQHWKINTIQNHICDE